MESIKSCEEILDQMISLNGEKFIAQSKRHVFYSLRHSHRNELTTEEMLNMKYHYTICERFITANNDNQPETAAWHFTNLLRISHNEFPEIVENGMRFMLFAAVSLRYYSIEEYEISADYMISAMKHGYKQTLTYTNEFLFAFGDTWFNLIRIYARWNKPKLVVEQTVKFLSFILFGSHDMPSVQAIYAKLDNDGKLSIINFVFSHIFRVINRMCKDHELSRDEIYGEIFSALIDNNKHMEVIYEPVLHSLKALDHYYKEEYDCFLSESDKSLDTFTMQPNGLRNFLTELVALFAVASKPSLAVISNP